MIYLIILQRGLTQMEKDLRALIILAAVVMVIAMVAVYLILNDRGQK